MGSGCEKILVTCPKGMAGFLKGELMALGFQVRAEDATGVATEGDLGDAMRLNLFLRTGHRVLFLISEFKASGPDELYEGVSSLKWEDIVSAEEYVTVTSSVDNPTIRDTRFANLRCKDAIVDRMMRRTGKRPDSGPERRGVVVHLHWRNNRCSLYLDTSGESLSNRGYRRNPFMAPLRETLSAAVVMATGWEGRENFVNPMCGSGTLAIEAALIGLGRPPGMLRRNFGFMHLKGFDGMRWEELRTEAGRAGKKGLEGRIVATDISPGAIAAARENAAAAGVEDLIDFSVGDFRDTVTPEGGGVVVLNPAYGVRLGEIKGLQAIYAGIGDFFKQKCAGYRGYVFTGNSDLAKKIGLRTKRRLLFFNGPIECRLLEYELYEGSRKAKFTARETRGYGNGTPT